jgi:hypothetical protein
MSPLEARTLLRAADIVGGLDRLAAYFEVSGEDFETWLAGKAPLPKHIYERCVNIVVACLLDELCPNHAKAKGSLH